MTLPCPVFAAADVEAMRGLAAELDAKAPSAGWGSLTDADLEWNAPLLLDVLRERQLCSRCPGLDACKKSSDLPRGTVAAQLKLSVDGAGRARVSACYGACGLIRELRQQARERLAEDTGQHAARRRARRDDDDTDRDPTPF